MTRYKNQLIFILRISLGWILLFAGISKVLKPDWTAAGFLNNAKTFPEFYAWFASPEILPITNFINEWGQLLLGVAIILGVVMTVSSILAVIMMLLYYFPILTFPMAGPNSFIVDQHIIFAIAFLLLASLKAGQYWGLSSWLDKQPFLKNYPTLKKWIVN